MILARSTKPFSNDLAVTLKRLIALLEEEEADDYGILQPSPSAFKLAMQFILEAHESIGANFPRASASTDEEGSIRLTWSKSDPDRQVRLVCPARSDRPAYLYHEIEDTYALEESVTVPTIVKWLEWLN
jgi:hypothetical protein